MGIKLYLYVYLTVLKIIIIIKKTKTITLYTQVHTHTKKKHLRSSMYAHILGSTRAFAKGRNDEANDETNICA